MERKHWKYIAVMVMCFLFGGFSIILYVMQASAAIWRSDAVAAARDDHRNASSVQLPQWQERNISTPGNLSEFGRRGMAFDDPYLALLSPFAVMFLAIGVVTTAGGVSIWNLVREKEIKSVKKSMMDVFLLPEEKRVMDSLGEHGGSLTQVKIAGETGFSRVKVHRIIRNLEMKKLVSKKPYGMTNKVVLNG